jgi:hypothetical protein
MVEIILKYCNPQVIIIIGAIISVCGGYLASIKTDKESEENGKKVELIQTLSKEIKNLSKINNAFASLNVDYSKKTADELEENKKKVELIQLLSNETKNLSEINNVFAQQNIAYSKNNELFVKQISEKADETNKQVTGGNSYVLFDVSFMDNTNIINFNTENLGDVKLENVTVTISDMERISSINPYKEDIYKESKKYITERFYPVLYPKSPIEDFDFRIDDKFDNIRLDVDIRFGNRHILQYIWILKYKTPEVRHGDVKVVENNKIIKHYTFGKSQEPTYIVK